MSTQTTSTTSTMPPTPTPRKSRRRWYYVVAFLLLLLAAPTAYYYYAGMARDQRLAALEAEIDAEDPDWRWPDLIAATNAKAPPDDSNSAVQIDKVQKLLRGNPFKTGDKWENAPLQHRHARLAPEYVEALRAAFVAIPAETLEEVRKLKDMPEGVYKLEAVEKPFTMGLDYVQETRNIATLLQWDAAMRAHDDDLEGAMDSCLPTLHTANALKDQPFLISQLVRVAEQSIGIGAIERTLGQGRVSESKLQKAQATLERQMLHDGLVAGLRWERAAGHHMYLQIRSGKSTFSEFFHDFRMNQGAAEHIVDVFPNLLLNGYPEYLRLMTENVRAAKMKESDRSEALARLDQELRKSRSNLLMMLIMPATTKVGEANLRVQALQRCTIAGLATERYRLKHNGAWPRNL